jgi:Flp pilus assembly protein TadG
MLRRRGRFRARRRRGAATVELALTLPLLLALLGGTLEVSRLLEARTVLSQAAREGGRQAAAGRLDEEGVRQVVRAYLQNAGLPITNATITVVNQTHPGLGIQEAEQLDSLRVAVSLPFADLRLVSLRIVTRGSTQVQAEATWYSLKDRPYPEFPEPPIE